MRVLVICRHPIAEGFAASAHATVRQALVDDARDVTDVDPFAEGVDRSARPPERRPAMLKGYLDRVWLLGVAFDVTRDGRVLTGRLKHIRRIIIVTTYGASRLPDGMARPLQHGPRGAATARPVSRSRANRDAAVGWLASTLACLPR